ncbi:hypothetical protein F406_gp098 [Agrobacterium phage 7-7-1]|uniref:Uncharacterized protein n=1 Tax=Agrobacterium phage 7-7-1 TaxID=1161931 RepID=J7F9D7_9CAUD|nr:hypothetical protein F406_gp098 [Agrobacterium phage 7-7-1]AFH19717.1 hypothetical protein 7-7-1_00019 [Agrobacterium phage 7-7-1]
MAKRVIVLDAYMRHPTVITVVREYPNKAVSGDDDRGIRIYATENRIVKIPLPSR